MGRLGPALPMADRSIGWEGLKEAHQTFGMRFPYVMTTSGHSAMALKNGAIYYDPKPTGVAQGDVVEFDPAKKAAILEDLEKYLSKHPGQEDVLLVFDVVDEPSNTMFPAFSRTDRPNDGKILDAVDAEIRASFGNGRYGLFDYRKPPDDDTPFERIAFVRWWNARMGKWAEDVYSFLREKYPAIPVAISNHNTVGSMPYVDFPLLSIPTDWTSADPYPTAVLSLYGRPRALYHTGFVTKWIHDLGGGKTTRIMPQGFAYHGRKPTPDDVREWASQALKNGATILNWYTSGPARVTIPETWEEILKINAQVKAKGAPMLPDKTRTAIFHSLSSQVGLGDRVLHPQYTLYALLGERIGSWFRFVGDTQKSDQGGDLSAFDLIYVPQAAYLTRDAAEALAAQAERGATVVFLDPLSFQNAADGGSLSDLRATLLGGSLGAPRNAARLEIVPNALPEMPQAGSLPLTPVAAGLHRGSVLAFDIEPPSDATVFATYEDGKPAAYSRSVGKGRILYFGALPFGNSDLATGNPEWESFLRALAEKTGEKTGLPIWNFYLRKQ